MRGWLLVAIIVIMEANQVILDHNNDILRQKQNEPNRTKRSQLDNKIKVQCGATNCDEIMLKGNVSKHFKLYTTVNNEATYATKSNAASTTVTHKNATHQYLILQDDLQWKPPTTRAKKPSN
eukprot:87914_1